MSYRPSTSPAGSAVVRRKTSITLSPLSLDIDEGTVSTLAGKLTEASGPNIGKAIQGKTVHLFIDGADSAVSAVTNAMGDFSISYTWATQGTYKYEIRYLGD